MRFDALPDTPLRLVHQGFEGLKRARWIDVAGKGLGFIVATDTRPSTLSVRLPTTDYLGGPHRLHGPYDAFAALNDVGILLLRR